MEMSPTKWNEIPVSDLRRASSFYASVFGTDELKRHSHGTQQLLLTVRGEQIGLLVEKPEQPPGDTVGPILIDIADLAELDLLIERAQQAGGQILQEKTSIGRLGAIALIVDTEGNHLALHCTNANAPDKAVGRSRK